MDRYSLTFVSKSLALQTEFYEQFPDQVNISIASEFPTIPVPNSALIIPCSNAFGLLDFGMTVVSKVLTIQDIERVKQTLFEYYQGEQCVSSSMLIEGTPIFSVLCWTALGRVRSALPADFPYSGLWSAFSAINKHNILNRRSKNIDKIIESIYLPDFSEYINTDSTDPGVVKEFVRQMSLAIRVWILNESHDVATLEAAEKRHKQIIVPQPISRSDIEASLLGLIYQLSGDIQTRGLCNTTELEILMQWVQENGKHTKPAAQVLAGLMKREDTDFTLKRSLILETILGSKMVLASLLDMVSAGKLQLHKEIQRTELTVEGSLLGQGTVGAVNAGTWKDRKVAIKTFVSVDEKSAKEFGREIGLLSLIEHAHIVPCFGASTDPKDLFIVEELLIGNLFDVLHDVSLSIPLSMKLHFTSGIASGMKYLHRCHLIHRDLKSLNVLIGTNLETKICDFGLSRFCEKGAAMAMTNNIGTVCWVAPEIFGRKPYNEKVDVYSFAIVFWEIMTRKQPFAESAAFSVPILVMKGERPPIPKEAPREWARLITKCWVKKAQLRPSFEEICAQLKKFKIDLQSALAHSKGADPERKKILVKEGSSFFFLTPELLTFSNQLSNDSTNKTSEVTSNKTSGSISSSSRAIGSSGSASLGSSDSFFDDRAQLNTSGQFIRSESNVTPAPSPTLATPDTPDVDLNASGRFDLDLTVSSYDTDLITPLRPVPPAPEIRKRSNTLPEAPEEEIKTKLAIPTSTSQPGLKKRMNSKSESIKISRPLISLDDSLSASSPTTSPLTHTSSSSKREKSRKRNETKF